MKEYSVPSLTKLTADFEVVFAKKSGHRDNGNGHSTDTGNIFGPNNGNNDKHKLN